MQVVVGRQPVIPDLSPLTHQKAIQMASKNHLSGEQKSFTMADLRIKWGRKVGKPGLQEKMPKHNMQFSPYFTVEEKKFLDSDEKNGS